MNVVVLAFASSIKLGCHALGTCHETRRLLHQTSVAARLADMRSHAKPAHVRLDNVDARIVNQFADTVELPRPRTPRVFVDGVSSASELMSVQCHAKLDELRRLLLRLFERLQPFRIVAMYIFMNLLQMTKPRAREGIKNNKRH